MHDLPLPAGRTRRAARSRPAPALLAAFLTLLTLLLGGCDETTAPADPFAGEVAVVVNSVDLTLTLFPTDSVEETRAVGLGPDGSPVGVSVRGDRAVVPMGLVPALKVVDVRSGEVERTVALPEGSGATGSAFLSDDVVMVANPGRNSVTRVDVETGTAQPEIPVGTYPQEIVVMDGRAFVINAELVDFTPAGPGTISVLEPGSPDPVVATIELSGENPGGAAAGPDGLLYVVHSGRFGEGNGSLSVVDPVSLEEVAHHTGFGEFPFALAFGPGGHLHVASFSYGIAVWDPATETFVRPPDQAVTPGDVASVSDVAVDATGRLWALTPDCQTPGAAHRLGADGSVLESVSVGVCPVAIAFAP